MDIYEILKEENERFWDFLDVNLNNDLTGLSEQAVSGQDHQPYSIKDEIEAL